MRAEYLKVEDEKESAKDAPPRPKKNSERWKYKGGVLQNQEKKEFQGEAEVKYSKFAEHLSRLKTEN